MEKSTIQTSRKIYALKLGLSFVTAMVSLYILALAIFPKVDPMVFTSAIGAAGIIIGALQIADGMKGHEPQ